MISTNDIHCKETIDIIHLAETDSSRDDISRKELDQLKSALIIHADSDEPSHFMQCVEERLSSFVRSPILLRDHLKTEESSRWIKFMEDQSSIFKKVDRVKESGFCHCEKEFMKSVLKRYDIVFFMLYAGTYHTGWDSVVTSVILDLVNRNELAVVFLRGTGKSIPMKLGFVRSSDTNDGYVEYSEGSNIQLLVDNINAVNNQSLTLFLSKNKEKLFTHTETILDGAENSVENSIENCISLSDSYICGICNTSLVNQDDWHYLAQSITQRKSFPWIVHKTKRVMFTPWYGYSHGNENQCLLTLFALRFLIHEHLKKFTNVNIFKNNLISKSNNDQLSDLHILFD